MHTLTSAENKKTESKKSSHPPLAWASTRIVLPRAVPGIQCPFKLIRIKVPTHTRRHIRVSIRIHAIHSRFRIISQKTTHTHTHTPTATRTSSHYLTTHKRRPARSSHPHPHSPHAHHTPHAIILLTGESSSSSQTSWQEVTPTAC